MKYKSTSTCAASKCDPCHQRGGTVAPVAIKDDSAQPDAVIYVGVRKKEPSNPVKIVAAINIGFGNRLYIRGNGCGLSWDRGVEMTPIDDCHWVWQCDYDCNDQCFEFKVLVNDETWSMGDNYVTIGLLNEINPSF
jgi:hypothetical protein